MKKIDIKISELLLKSGNYLKENKKADLIATIIVFTFLAYQIGYRVGKLFSHLLS